MSRENILELWGIFFGLIIGFLVTKIYQIWALLFITEGWSVAGIAGWPGLALWEIATTHPFGFLVFVEVLFAGIGYLFIKTFFKHVK